MTLTVWISLVVVCVLGTMSPGPSLAVVLRQALSNGRLHGILTALSHSIGVLFWALLTIWGLGVLVAEHPLLYTSITYLGAAYLAWLGVKAFCAAGQGNLEIETRKSSPYQAMRDGIMISLLNPKLAIFFIALFSQFVSVELNITDKLIMMLTAASIDSLWYISLVLVVSHPKVMAYLQKREPAIERLSGLVLIGLALRVATV